MKDLFGDEVTVAPVQTGQRRCGPKGGKHYVQQRGYAAPPGTGPKDETCGSCKHIHRGRKYRKCWLMQAAWTHGPRTDILARAPACRRWEKPDDRDSSV